MTDGNHGGAAPTDEERARAVREQLKSIHATDLAYEMAVSLVSFGYQKLGLTDETREIRDLEDARMAIDLLGAVVEVMDKESSDDLVRDLHASVAQMQMSYARTVLAEGPEAAAAATTAAAAGETTEAAAGESESQAAEDAARDVVEDAAGGGGSEAGKDDDPVAVEASAAEPAENADEAEGSEVADAE